MRMTIILNVLSQNGIVWALIHISAEYYEYNRKSYMDNLAELIYFTLSDRLNNKVIRRYRTCLIRQTMVKFN